MEKRMIKVSVLKEHPRANILKIAEIKNIIVQCAKVAKLSKAAEVSVLFCDDEKIRQLNKQFRNKDKPTNVLAFESGELNSSVKNIYLGDIAISIDTVEAEAKEQCKLVRSHITHILIHGFLHLMGYDHIKKDDQDKMEAIEIDILSHFNISNPYES